MRLSETEQTKIIHTNSVDVVDLKIIRFKNVPRHIFIYAMDLNNFGKFLWENFHLDNLHIELYNIVTFLLRARIPVTRNQRSCRILTRDSTASPVYLYQRHWRNRTEGYYPLVPVHNSAENLLKLSRLVRIKSLFVRLFRLPLSGPSHEFIIPKNNIACSVNSKRRVPEMLRIPRVHEKNLYGFMCIYASRKLCFENVCELCKSENFTTEDDIIPYIYIYVRTL